jgi:hypothetical protein
MCEKKLRAFAALTEDVCSTNRRSDQAGFELYVWAEVTMTDDSNLFICIHYITSAINVDIIKNDFIPQKTCLMFNFNYRIHLLKDFNDPNLTGIMDVHPLIVVIMEIIKLKGDMNDYSVFSFLKLT